MIKALKKLKNWHRKKKRKKNSLQNPYPIPIPIPVSHCCSCSAKARPSAPPLPPWFDIDESQEAAAPVSDLEYGSFPSTPQNPLPASDAIITAEITPLVAPSYQQYLAPEPVFGVPIMPVPPPPPPPPPVSSAGEGRSAGLFGCVISIGTFLIRRLCLCFRFRD